MLSSEPAIDREVKMRQSWKEARAQCQAALGELVEGRPEARAARSNRRSLRGFVPARRRQLVPRVSPG